MGKQTDFVNLFLESTDCAYSFCKRDDGDGKFDKGPQNHISICDL